MISSPLLCVDLYGCEKWLEKQHRGMLVNPTLMSKLNTNSSEQQRNGLKPPKKKNSFDNKARATDPLQLEGNGGLWVVTHFLYVYVYGPERIPLQEHPQILSPLSLLHCCHLSSANQAGLHFGVFHSQDPVCLFS